MGGDDKRMELLQAGKRNLGGTSQLPSHGYRKVKEKTERFFAVVGGGRM